MRKISNLLLTTAFGIASLGYITLSSAHDAIATMDPDSNVPGFIGYAKVTCGAKDTPPTAYLTASIKDLSPPQDNLLVSVQVIHLTGAAIATDLISGDDGFSPEARVYGGDGEYLILVNKTAAGARHFHLIYHCWSDQVNDHAETQIFVRQFQ